MENVRLFTSQVTSALLNQIDDSMLERLDYDEACQFHFASGGSRTRAKICIQAGIALGIQQSQIIALAVAVELLHNASLVHDDLQDGDAQRRGQLSVWKKFGKARAICTGDAMINAAYGALTQLSEPEHISLCLGEVTKAVAETIKGQTLDLDKKHIKDSKHYEHIAAQKSGPLFRLALALPLVVNGRKDLLPNVNYIAAKFAIAYQIIDDIEDWENDSEHGTLNIVSILAQTVSINEALFIAQNRVKYLLMMCKKELALLPNNCALEVVKVADNLIKCVD